MGLKRRKLGSQGLEVTEIGLGCFTMAGPYGAAEEGEALATIRRAMDLGCTFFDTAEVYGPFTNEELLGKALGERRREVIVATKFGFRIEHGKPVGFDRDSRPERIRAAVEGSLKRVRTDYIDLLYQHRVDPAVPMEEVAGCVGELVHEGKVRFFGLSEAGVGSIRRAHAVHPVSAVQSEYSLWERNLEADVLPALRELGIGLVPYCPLGRGFLTGDVKRAEEYPENDFRRTDPRYQGEHFDANMRAVEVVKGIGAKRRATPAQVALAWILHKGTDIVPIPGTKRRKYLEENLAAAEIGLSDAEMKELDEALAPGKIAGPRYGGERMAMIDR